jgi:hypothetical protein
MIKKDTVLELVVEGMEFKTKKEAKEVAEAKIKEINDLITKIGATLGKDEKARLGNLEISKVEVAERSGTMKGKAWTKPAHLAVKVKVLEDKAE